MPKGQSKETVRAESQGRRGRVALSDLSQT